jgi:hypothetical protein
LIFLIVREIHPGQTLPAIYNNLYRAPIFSQNVSPTDFLCIRQTHLGITKFFVREIPSMYLAGQTFPCQEVPRPQARKITQSLKTRLQSVAFRLMLADPFKRLRYDKLRRYFPMFAEDQIKLKLKEFCQYLKKGENTGWWKLKGNVQLPDEDGIRKIMTPEMVLMFDFRFVLYKPL